MPHSYAQQTSLTCPHCDQEVAIDVWLIVDVVERPDLAKRIQKQRLYMLVCPHCGETAGQVDAPLLLFLPEQTPPLLFSPAQQTTAEEDQEQARGLLERLRASLGCGVGRCVVGGWFTRCAPTAAAGSPCRRPGTSHARDCVTGTRTGPIGGANTTIYSGGDVDQAPPGCT